MNTKKAIEGRADIKVLIDDFYTKVREDEVIGHFFTEVVQLSWEHHIPVMYDFWEAVLFGVGGYKGNPVLKHIALHQKEALTQAHFSQWKKLFFETLDAHFEGEKVEDAKKKVEMMERLMLYKIEASESRFFVQ
ncbi:MAG: group III truncated hemoglobin [Chitinophagales bacterium]